VLNPILYPLVLFLVDIEKSYTVTGTRRAEDSIVIYKPTPLSVIETASLTLEAHTTLRLGPQTCQPLHDILPKLSNRKVIN
jgi:hypothetical protein